MFIKTIAIGTALFAVIVTTTVFVLPSDIHLSSSLIVLTGALTILWGCSELLQQQTGSRLPAIFCASTYLGVGVVGTMRSPQLFIPLAATVYGVTMIGLGVERLVGQQRAGQAVFRLGVPAVGGVGLLIVFVAGMVALSIVIAFFPILTLIALYMWSSRGGRGRRRRGWGGGGCGWGGDGGDGGDGGCGGGCGGGGDGGGGDGG